MNQPNKNDMLAAALRRAAPVIKQLRAEPEPVPPTVLQRLRRALDAPCDEPPKEPGERLIEQLLTLLVEAPQDIPALVTGLRVQSIRCNETHVSQWMDLLLGRGIVVRNRAAEAEGRNAVFELTVDGHAYIGRTAPAVRKAKVKQKLTRED